MIRSLAALLLGATALLGASSSASAWTKFHNASTFSLSSAHVYSATSGFLCGYSDGCPSNWRMEGWWNLAPGATATVEGHAWGNAYHQVFGFDGLGHEWGGGPDSFGIPTTAFSGCQYDFLSKPTTQYRYFFRWRMSRCCGGSCPSNAQFNFL